MVWSKKLAKGLGKMTGEVLRAPLTVGEIALDTMDETVKTLTEERDDSAKG